MNDPTIPPQLCDDRTTHEAHKWLDSDNGNPANHIWWCPGLSYAHLEQDDEMSIVANQIRDEFKERIGLRIQTMQDEMGRTIQEANRLLAKIHRLDDDLIAIKMELENE